MKLTPVNDRVLIKQVQEPDNIGSVLIPDIAKGKTYKGTIVEIPADCKHPERIKQGAEVYFGKYSGIDVTLDNEKLLFVNVIDILAVEEENCND